MSKDLWGLALEAFRATKKKGHWPVEKDAERLGSLPSVVREIAKTSSDIETLVDGLITAAEDLTETAKVLVAGGKATFARLDARINEVSDTKSRVN